ncbi:helicase-associated domain-containing protein [Arthrobacter sp. 35W]|uniref:helicase-associated domain-containing protein n=1 Tax=Arthrobacter sp. 35W TaxID=1132441 RepID=UPI0003F5F0D5|nr:helicase-associated domain-containing protein [Arthrobacter sp. 35W]
MSSLKVLTKALAGRSDASLRSLLLVRPDLAEPPAVGFAALAARATSRASMSRALDSLTAPQLQVLETLHLDTDVDAGIAAGAADLAGYLRGGTVAGVQSILAELAERALIHPWPEDSDPSVLPQYLPVSSLKDVIGAHPAGLGRSYRAFAQAGSAVWGPHLVAVAADLRSHGAQIAPAATPLEAAAALAGWVEQFANLDHLLLGAPEAAAALLSRFATGPIGSVPPSARGGALLHANLDDDGGTALGWLVSRGLLVPIDDEHVELPAEVSALVRGGWLVADFSPEPPAVELKQASVAVRNNASVSAIAELLRTTADLVAAVSAAPVATLRTGGVGVREVRRLASALRVDSASAAFHLELAAMASLVVLDVDTSRWVARADGWLSRPRPEQWLWLASAWLASDRVPALVGAASSLASAGTGINALAAEAQRPEAPALRRRVLAAMAELGAAGAAAPAGASGSGQGPAKAPVLDAAAVLARFRWHHPRQVRRVVKLLPGFLAEAELLGITGAGVLTPPGSAVAQQRWEAALAQLAETLPAALEHVILQGDLTAVAPGYLSPALAGELALLADAEGQGPATIFRFSAASIRRALDAGRTGADIAAFLSKHSATPVPQPLDYLVRDTAARHGHLKVGAASSFVICEDESLLAGLPGQPAFAALGLRLLAPTAAVSTASVQVLAAALAAAGLAPAMLDPADNVLSVRRRAVALPPPGLAPYERPGSGQGPGGTDSDAEASDGADSDSVDAALALLRSRPAWQPHGAEAAPALVLETLGQAIRRRRMVRMSVVDSSGNTEELAVLPLSLSGGRVRTYDEQGERERVFSIHRIMDVELEPAIDPKEDPHG